MLNIDRYHATMGDASYKDVTRLHERLLSEAEATFYVAQRKLPYAPCLGHERLIRSFLDLRIDRPRLRTLEQDRGGMRLFAKAVEDITFAGTVRAVRPGTITFTGQPFADITGAFGLAQAQEIKFEHAVDVATYAFIGGFNDTSNMEAAHRLEIPAVGTEAHYWQQSYIEFMDEPEIEPRTGRPKHFEQVAFERWLDANPQGTTLLLDTIDVHMGAVHAALAATSTEARRRAFKGFRVDSGDLARLGKWCLEFSEANGLRGLMPVLTGDLDAEQIRRVVEEFPEVAGFGIGTKLSGEVRRIAGVIFKECVIGGRPTMKVSDDPEKSTLPGRLQIFRGIDGEGRYVGDVVGLDDEEIEIDGASRVERLLAPFWEGGRHESIPSIVKQKAFVEEQLRRFPDINSYPHTLSDRLRTLRDELTARMRRDDSGWQQTLSV